MSALKTQKNDASVEDFLKSIDNENRKEDSFVVLELMKKITGTESSMGVLLSLVLEAIITNMPVEEKVIGF